MTPPAGLQAPGRALWTDVLGDLPDGWEFDRRELAILKAAAKQADAIAALERAVKRDGVMIAGAQGQRRLNAAVTEVRQGRLALARLLGELDIPADDGRSARAASQRARRAAEVRWADHNARKAALRG